MFNLKADIINSYDEINYRNLNRK